MTGKRNIGVYPIGNPHEVREILNLLLVEIIVECLNESKRHGDPDGLRSDDPFFLEESVRGLIETRELVGEPGAYRLAQELPTIQVPATVQAILAARIDRLPAGEKDLLQTAAVIGTEVPLPLLQAIAELSKETLHRGLAHLQVAEFLYETSLYPERVYTFKHALTHEVAYGSLLQERRRTLHARIVEALETERLSRLNGWLSMP